MFGELLKKSWEGRPPHILQFPNVFTVFLDVRHAVARVVAPC